jgi:preprotein translocase subunit SecG
MLNNLLAMNYEIYSAIQLTILIVTAICAIFVIIVVLIQPGNSNGISAIDGGMTDTFYGKNKSKTLASKLRKLTVVCVALMAVLMIAYFLLQLLLKF